MTYQDIWVNGKCIQKGKRDCENRYKIVHAFCKNSFLDSFTVLDIGANMCYFGLRLIEDFNATVIAFEFDQFEMRNAIINKNKTSRLMFLRRKLSIPDLQILAKISHFDLVLAMSVMHHLPGDHQEWLQILKLLGKNIIIEYALTDSTRSALRKNYIIPSNAKWLGYADSHLNKNINRPIVLL